MSREKSSAVLNFARFDSLVCIVALFKGKPEAFKFNPEIHRMSIPRQFRGNVFRNSLILSSVYLVRKV